MRLGQVVLVIAILVGCHNGSHRELDWNTAYTAVVVQPSRTYNRWAGLFCWAVVELPGGERVVVTDPTELCLTLTEPGRRVRVLRSEWETGRVRVRLAGGA